MCAVRTTTTAISSAQPTCRLGIAANWLATVATSPSYADGPNTAIVSRKPRLDSIRGGASGIAMCSTMANAVRVMISCRAHRYSAGGRRSQPHTRNASVTGKCTET